MRLSHTQYSPFPFCFLFSTMASSSSSSSSTGRRVATLDYEKRFLYAGSIGDVLKLRKYLERGVDINVFVSFSFLDFYTCLRSNNSRDVLLSCWHPRLHSLGNETLFLGCQFFWFLWEICRLNSLSSFVPFTL